MIYVWYIYIYIHIYIYVYIYIHIYFNFHFTFSNLFGLLCGGPFGLWVHAPVPGPLRSLIQTREEQRALARKRSACLRSIALAQARTHVRNKEYASGVRTCCGCRNMSGGLSLFLCQYEKSTCVNICIIQYCNIEFIYMIYDIYIINQERASRRGNSRPRCLRQNRAAKLFWAR